jgi:CDP-paratose 2-epimerase
VKVLVTGANGFVGSALMHSLRELGATHDLLGVDNLSRPGSELNREKWRQLGVRILHGDIRVQSDVDAWPQVDWVIDAAANPSVLAGLDSAATPRQVVDNNLLGTVNVLEYCRRSCAGFILLSSSRVYSIDALRALPLVVADQAFTLRARQSFPPGVRAGGIDEAFPTSAPISLYGATKLASEALALEYGSSFGLPVWVNRCGLLAGAGQFGRLDQGILAYWINAYLRRAPLRYIGHAGSGAQVRDALHPRDLAALVCRQLESPGDSSRPRVLNVGGGAASAFSLAQLTRWCRERFGFEHPIGLEMAERPADVPWLVLDAARAEREWSWRPETALPEILSEIATHAEKHPEWLQQSAGG